MKARILEDIYIGSLRLKSGSIVTDDGPMACFLPEWIRRGMAAELKDAGPAPENKMLHVEHNKRASQSY